MATLVRRASMPRQLPRPKPTPIRATGFDGSARGTHQRVGAACVQRARRSAGRSGRAAQSNRYRAEEGGGLLWSALQSVCLQGPPWAAACVRVRGCAAMPPRGLQIQTGHRRLRESNSARNVQPATVTTSAAGADIPLSAVDFHCSNLLEALISPGCSARAAIDRCARVFKTTKCSAKYRLPVRTAANRNRAAGVASRVTCRILRLVPTSATLWSHQQIGDKVRELIWKKRSSKSNKAALGSEESAPVDQEMVQLEVRQVGEVPVSCLAAVQSRSLQDALWAELEKEVDSFSFRYLNQRLSTKRWFS